jgi:CDP-6-deoxy-D-xylo-4-hexulose-3-dehydrase
MRYPLMRNNISRDDLDVLISYLKNDDPRLTQGEKVKEFEKLWSEWLGVRYSVFVNSGSSANLISIACLKNKFPDGGQVIVPPLTWVSDIASLIQYNFEPVFVDIELNSLAMNAEKIIDKINPKTRAIFLTHIQGFNGLSDILLKEISNKNIFLIEDVCESHGASHEGKKLGSFGWISNFSFYYAHHMSTIEGGMVSTNDEEVYNFSRLMRSHGMLREIENSDIKSEVISQNPELNPEFIFMYPAYNMRNTEIGAVLGINQLKKLDGFIEKRNKNFLYFLSQLDKKIYFTDFKLDGISNYAFNIFLLDDYKDKVDVLMTNMKREGIEFRRGSAGGGNQLRQPYLKNYVPENYHINFPVVEHVHFYGFYIGNFPSLTEHEIDDICSVLNNL